MATTHPPMTASITTPRVILHGGAGNITHDNLPLSSYLSYRSALLHVLQETNLCLQTGTSALDAATFAVTLLEDNPLFNCGRGAVFTRDGTIELEASVMVSRGYRKRGVGVSVVKKVKNPIKLAREMLVRGEKDGSTGHADGGADPSGGSGGAQGHCQLSGPIVEDLAKSWGLEMCEENYHWTKKRWDEHQKGLEDEAISSNAATTTTTTTKKDWPGSNEDPSWNGHDYLPQGTVGAVCLDHHGVLCVATSTGGLTNKLAGRIGDTPTLGAGFWAEEWMLPRPRPRRRSSATSSISIATTALSPLASMLPDGLWQTVGTCIPGLVGYTGLTSLATLQELGHGLHADPDTTSTSSAPSSATSGTSASAFSAAEPSAEKQSLSSHFVRAVAMSGTGNGDSFLRLAAVRTAGSIARFARGRSLASAVKQMAGQEGELQRSAGDRWGMTGEGEGGIIGLELLDGKCSVAFDFNCGGMFRAWTDDGGIARMMVFKEEY